MPLRASILTLSLFLLLPATASADDWSDALHAEFEQADTKKAIKLYRKVAKAKGPRAAEARLRRIDLLAKTGKATALKGAITAFLQAHPGHKRTAALKTAKADPKAFITKVQARPDTAKANAKVRKVLKSRPVTLNFPDTPLTEVASFLADITGVSVVVLGDVPDNTSVNLRLKDKILEDAMVAIVKGPKLAYDVVGGALVIAKNPAALKPLAFTKKQIAVNPDAYLKLRSYRITLNFDGTPMSDVGGFLGDITGIKVTVAADIKDADVTVRLRNTLLSDTMTLMLAGPGAEVKLTAHGITIAKRAKAKPTK